MAAQFVLALDQGTTSSRSILFDHGGQIRGAASQEYRQIYPRPGWVEHDANEIWESQLATAKKVIADAGIGPEDITAIGISNQRETTLIWNRKTGEPVANAIVWQCRRTADACDRLKAEGFDEEITSRTGLVVDAYFSGTKVQWLLDNVDGVRKRAESGDLCFGTVDSWLLFKLTGQHATDHTNASRTMLYNIHELQWDPVLLDKLTVPESLLPEVKPSSGVFGTTTLLGGEIPVSGVAGDQQAALFGQAAFATGDSKNTYGTGCFLLANTGTQPVASQNGLVTTIAWGLNDKVEYALEGSVFIAGAVVQWLRDELQIIEHASDTEGLANSVPDTGGVHVVPAFVGLGAPYWDQHARGVISGLTRGTNRAHIVRAALESISFQSGDLLDAMRSDAHTDIRSLKVDGGACANNFLMQHQANVAGVPVIRGKMLETTALGAAYLAGLAVGFWKDQAEVARIWAEDRVFEPEWDQDRRESEKSAWNKAVERARLG